ncbi:hypothetical protein B0H10DRAFT_1958989 [Mycena sp. CBHHK59/15]|nr:hypothetical protein B0H10DRAFT_1958989 [Mycena sp. CBHHK59/15]
MPPNDLSSIASDNPSTYASGMTTSLRTSLATERHAHAETHSDSAARARICLLEAQLARWEANLEEYAMHAGPPFPRASPRHPNVASISDMTTFLDRTMAQNAVLEQEVEQLAAQLTQAHLATKRDVPLSDVRQTVSGSAIADLDPQTPSRPSNSEHRTRHRRRSISHERPRRAASPGDPDRTIPSDPLLALPATTDSEDVYAALTRELAVLGAQIEEFHIEKEILLAQVQAESYTSGMQINLCALE